MRLQKLSNRKTENWCRVTYNGICFLSDAHFLGQLLKVSEKVYAFHKSSNVFFLTWPDFAGRYSSRDRYPLNTSTITKLHYLSMLFSSYWCSKGAFFAAAKRIVGRFRRGCCMHHLLCICQFASSFHSRVVCAWMWFAYPSLYVLGLKREEEGIVWPTQELCVVYLFVGSPCWLVFIDILIRFMAVELLSNNRASVQFTNFTKYYMVNSMNLCTTLENAGWWLLGHTFHIMVSSAKMWII